MTALRAVNSLSFSSLTCVRDTTPPRHVNEEAQSKIECLLILLDSDFTVVPCPVVGHSGSLFC